MRQVVAERGNDDQAGYALRKQQGKLLLLDPYVALRAAQDNARIPFGHIALYAADQVPVCHLGIVGYQYAYRLSCRYRFTGHIGAASAPGVYFSFRHQLRDGLVQRASGGLQGIAQQVAGRQGSSRFHGGYHFQKLLFDLLVSQHSFSCLSGISTFAGYGFFACRYAVIRTAPAFRTFIKGFGSYRCGKGS